MRQYGLFCLDGRPLTGLWLRRLAVVVTVMLGLVIIPSNPAFASYRYDCNEKKNTFVIRTFMANPPNGGGFLPVELQCGIPGPNGYGLRHILDPGWFNLETGEPSREPHFAGYLSDWEAYGFRHALANEPHWQFRTDNHRYDESIPIFDNKSESYLGTQTFTVIVDWSTIPGQIKTAWGNPEDIRSITKHYYKMEGWVQPDDWLNLFP